MNNSNKYVCNGEIVGPSIYYRKYVKERKPLMKLETATPPVRCATPYRPSVLSGPTIRRSTNNEISIKDLMNKLIALSEKLDKQEATLLREVRSLKRCVREIVDKRKRTELLVDNACVSLERQLQLPISNSFSLTCNDSKLVRNEEHRAKFIECLKRYATPIKDSTQRLKRIYTNVFAKKIASEFNWTGMHGKMAFKDSETVKTINEYFRTTILDNEAVNIEELVKRWLKNKSDLNTKHMQQMSTEEDDIVTDMSQQNNDDNEEISDEDDERDAEESVTLNIETEKSPKKIKTKK